MADFNIPQLRNRRLSSLLADPSVMDNYQPTQPLSGLLDYSDPAVKAGPDAIGPPTIAGGLLSLDPTDYVGPQTLGKLAAGLKGLLAGGMVMGGIKPAPQQASSAAQELLRQAQDGWSRAIGDSGQFITKKQYALPVTINDKTINFAAHKNSGAGPLHLTRIAETKFGPVLRTYKLEKDGNLGIVGDKNLFALTDEARAYHLDEFNRLFNSE